MSETKPLIKVEKRTVETTIITSWYNSEEKDPKSKVMYRIIMWTEGENHGMILYYMYKKNLYDKLFKHFNLQKNPPFTISLNGYRLYTKWYETEWYFPEGDILCYQKWISPIPYRYKDQDGEGKIDLRIYDSKNLFDKLYSHAIKFMP